MMSYISKINEYIESNNLLEAKKILLDAININSEFYLYHEKLGDVYLRENDLHKAKSCYEIAINLHKNAEWIKIKLDSLGNYSQTDKTVANFCGIYDFYPDKTGRRQAEGGQRIKGKLKSSLPHLPLVTIVTAVYNNIDTFQRCIDSVRSQTYANVEYLVIDGGSCEETLNVIKKNDDFIDYFISEPDSGIYSAMNKGIELARGEFVCLLNSDDVYDSEYVKKTIDAINDDDSIDIIYTDYYVGDNLLQAQTINSGILFGHLHICHNTFLTRKSCYDRIGRYDESYKIVSDAVWMRKAFIAGAKFKCLNEPLFTLTEGGLSSGNTEERRKLFIQEVIDSYRLSFPSLTPSDAEEIYLFRFNKQRAKALQFIAKKYNYDQEITDALRKYVEHCLRDRKNFILGHTESSTSFLELSSLVDELHADIKSIQINTGRGYLSDVLKNIDKIILLKKKHPCKTILHFVTVFSAPPETFIYDLLLRLENETIYDNFILYEHELLRTERPFSKAIHVPWSDFRPEVATVIYKYIIESLNIDVVIGHFALNEWKMSTRIKPLNLSIPTISMTHGIDAFCLRDKIDYKKYIVEDFCSRSNTAFTAVSEYLIKELLSNGVPRDKITLLHNTVDERFFNHRKKDNFYDGKRTLKLLCVGRLIKWKGHEYLIRGLKSFMVTCTHDVHLTIVYGKCDDLLENLEALIQELNISDNVALVPYVNFKEQPDYFAAFDCYIHPSTYSDDKYQQSETFGVAVLEAITAGLPVISSDAGGLKEVIGDERIFAQVVPHANSEAIAGALARFWKSRVAFSDNRTFAEDCLKRFSARAQIAELSKLIAKVTSSPIQVALFSSSTIQGAGYAAYRLHKGLRLLPNHSLVSDIFTTVRNHEAEPAVHVLKHPSGNNANWKFLQPAPKPDLTIFTLNQPNISSRDLLAMTAKHDIINLHWHARFLSIENIATLTQLGKPVVMTIRDMFPLTGGCHCFHGCERWQGDCSDCPQIPSAYKDYPAKILAAKRRYYNFSNLTLVALSSYSRRIIESAPFFNTCRIEVIPNSIETDVFRPYDKMEARRKLGLPLDRPIICYIPSFSSNVKGFKEILEAFEILKASDLSLNPFVLLLGNETPATANISFDKKNIGYISDNDRLAEAYSSVDVVVVPSLEETFSNTTAEAISCGVPVVGFKTGAIPDLALNGKTGFTCEIGDVRGLAEGIKTVLRGPNLAENCRAHALSYLSFMKQAKRYEALFHELVACRGEKHAEGSYEVHDFFGELGQDMFGITLEMHKAK